MACKNLISEQDFTTKLFLTKYPLLIHCVLVGASFGFSISKNSCNSLKKSYIRDHPFKTSACFRGGEVSPLPTFADARGVGVSGMSTSVIFDSMYQETNSNFKSKNM